MEGLGTKYRGLMERKEKSEVLNIFRYHHREQLFHLVGAVQDVTLMAYDLRKTKQFFVIWNCL